MLAQTNRARVISRFIDEPLLKSFCGKRILSSFGQPWSPPTAVEQSSVILHGLPFQVNANHARKTQTFRSSPLKLQSFAEILTFLASAMLQSPSPDRFQVGIERALKLVRRSPLLGIQGLSLLETFL